MKRRGRRFLRAAAIVSLVVLAFAVVLGVWIARGRLLENLLESNLSRHLGVPVEVASVSILAPLGARVEDLRVSSPRDPSRPCVQIPELRLRFGGSGPAGLASAEVHGAQVVVTEEDGRLDVLELLHLREPVKVVPHVTVRDARIRLQGNGTVCAAVARVLVGDAWGLDVHSLDLVARGDPGHVGVQGLVSLPGLAPLEVSGELGGGGAEGAVQTRGQPLDLAAPALRACLDAVARRWLEENACAGPVSARAHWDGEALQLTAELLGIALTPRQFPCRIENVRGRLVLEDDTLTLEGLRGDHRGIGVRAEGSVADLSVAPRLDVRLYTDPFQPTDAVFEAVRRVRGEQLLDAFHPEGLLRAECRWTTAADGRPEFQHRVDLLDAALRFDGFVDASTGRRRGFPLPVRQVRGTALLGRELFELRDAAGVTATGGRVEGTVTVEGHGEERRIRVHVAARSVPVEEQFEAACAAALGEPATRWFERLGVSGNVDQDLEYVREPGSTSTLAVTLHPRGTTLHPAGSPVPLRLLGGSVRLHREGAVLENLEGEIGGEGTPGRFRLEGRVGGAGTGPFDLRLSVQDLPLAAALPLAAEFLPRDRPDVLEQFGDEGALDLELHCWRPEAGGATRWEGTLRLAQARWMPAELPLPLSDVRVALRFSGEEGGDFEVGISAEEPLQGTLLDGTVTVRGSVSRAGGELELLGERLYVTTRDRENSALLRITDAFRPELTEFLVGLQAVGWVRFQARLRRDAGSWEIRSLDLAPDFPAHLPPPGEVAEEAVSAPLTGGVTLRLAAFSKPLVWRDGVIRGAPGEGTAQVENLRASLGGATLFVPQGTLHRGSDQLDVVLSGTFDTVSAEDLLDPLLAPAARALLRRWNLRGVSHADVQEVRVSVPHDEPFPSEVHVVAQLELRHTGLRVAGGLEDLAGVLTAQCDYERPAAGKPRLKIVGEISGASFLLGPFPVSNVSAKLLVSDGVLALRDIDAELAGGRFNAADNWLRFPLAVDEPFEGTLHLEGAQLDRLLGEHDPRTKDWEGQLDVDLRLWGEGAQLSQLRSEGTIRVREGQLWKIPVFDKIFELGLSRVIGVKERPKFESGTVHLEMFRGIVWLTDLDLVGTSLRLQGDAVLSPGGVDAHLFPEVAVDIPFVDIPMIGRIVQSFARGVERRALSFRFGGPWQDLQVRWDPISARPGARLGESLDRPRTSDPRPVVSRPRF